MMVYFILAKVNLKINTSHDIVRISLCIFKETLIKSARKTIYVLYSKINHKDLLNRALSACISSFYEGFTLKMV